MDGQVTWLDLGISCGKTWSEPLAATKEKTSQPCWKKLRVSQNQDFLYLDCRKSGNGQKQEPSTVMGGLSLGELTTLRTGEKPSETAVQEMLSVWGPHSVAEESRLSQILEVNPLPKYNLTAKACLGILRRAEQRGKDLPERLKAVLIRQSQGDSPQERTEATAPTEAPTSYAVRIRGGCDGGGKGALVQTEKSGTLGTGNDQTIFCMATQQGGSELRTDDRAPTLTAAAGMSGNNQPVVCAGFKLGNSEQARSIGYQEELSPTLNAECGGNKPAVVAPAVALDMTHACDVIRECGEQVPALQARMGTGGNQVPLTYGIGNGQACEASIMAEEVSQTLNTMHDAQAVLTYQDVTGTLSPGAHAGSYNGQDAYNDMLVCGATPDVAHALREKAPCAYREDAETYPVQNMVVRRLTPLECTRLQGYPDGWVDIGDWTDEKGKKHKDADSPKYKALGNSIALPFWDWMLRRMARYLPEGATLGSLFDGIAGFPLIWERIHGRGTARWASEIEPFPIAVTKRWFGEE